MEHRIAEIQAKLEAIGDELTDVSVEVLREAVADGASARPAVDKKLSQARRAVEKAARLLGQAVDGEQAGDGFDGP